MKSNLYKSIFSLVLVSCLFVTSCDKSIEFTEQLTPLQPASLDEDAGAWKMAFMTAPDQVPVAAPAAANAQMVRPRRNEHAESCLRN